MLHSLVVSQSVLIQASCEKVWLGLTSPAIIKEYLFGTETLTDWKIGSEIVFQGEYQGQKYRDHGVILENDFLKKISYSYWSGFSGTEDKPENYSTISLELVQLDENQTSFTWTQSGFTTDAAYEHSKKGMDDFLKLLKEVIER